jgi:hypothetical protein
MIGATDYRDPITQSLLQRQALARQRQQVQPQGPWAAPRPMPPVPTMGTPAPRPPEAEPQYGFATGFNAAGGGGAAPYDPRASKDKGWKDLYDKLFGVAASAGGAAP